MVSRSGPVSAGGAAVAQGGRARRTTDWVCLGFFALITLGLWLWARAAVRAACGGSLGAPLDDSYIHFQFARGFARLRPFEYAPGLPPVPGATSLLWPALLTPALWAGASSSGLIALTWLLGFGALFGQAAELYLSARRFLSLPFSFAAGLLVLCFSANTWFAASSMEVVPLGFLLLRAVRRSAEFADGERSSARAWELSALALAAALLRPEGALGALCVAAALARSGRAWLARAAAALAAPLSLPLVNWWFTGSATQTTTLAKWLLTNPYYSGRLGDAVLGNLRLLGGTLLDGREWSWTFIPEGYRWVAWLCLPAVWLSAERRGARGYAAGLCLVGLGMLIPTTYETFLVNRLRYLWPFSGPWLLGLAALGELLLAPVARAWPRLALAGLLLPALGGYGFVKLAPISLGDLAESAAAISAQQVALGQWAAHALPQGARIGVNDAGAIAFFSGRQTFDVVGLTTRGEARYWVAGAGSRFEHYEHLSRAELPTHFVVYPEWFGIPPLLGEYLTERRVDGATILGGPRMVAYRADYSSLGSGAAPTLDVGSRRLVDELDVADLESEARHAYVLGAASASDDVVEALSGRADGGRARRSHEAFRLELEPSGLLVIRLSSEESLELTLSVGGRDLGSFPLGPGQFQEIALPLPATLAGNRAPGPVAVDVHSSRPATWLHYWSLSRVL